MKVKIFILITFAMQLAFAQTTVGLKDVYSSKFKFGNILNGTTANNSAMQAIVLREFNSITPENELKPDATIVASGSTDDNVKVQLNNGAQAILKFCQDNNIPVRGHTLVWHSQTPEWFFRTGFTSSGAVVSKAVMKKRMESYIKNMFALIKSSYPNLNLYAYDVVNEAASESGGPRTAGNGDGKSMWVQVYGDNSFIEEAFTFARKYAPATTKLFYNDYNEYITTKRNYIANSIVKPLKDKGLIDGMGMQSHLDVRTGTPYPTPADYGAAITMYKNLGVEIHVSELDATVDDGNTSYLPAQATYYKNIMNEILTKGGSAVTAVVIWGIRDDQSWRKPRKPVLFDDNGNKKAAYDELVKLIPQSDWGNPGGSSSSISVTCNVNNLQPSYTAGSNKVPRPNVTCGNGTTAGAASFYASGSTGSTDVVAGWNSSGGTNDFYNTGTRTITLGEVMCGTTKVTLSPAISCGSFNVVAASSSSGTNNGSSSSTAASLSSSSSLANSSSSLASSSSTLLSSSSNGAESSSSSEGEDVSPTLHSQLSTLNSQLASYYSIKGEPLGNAKPQKAGVYIVKQGNSVKKIAVR